MASRRATFRVVGFDGRRAFFMVNGSVRVRFDIASLDSWARKEWQGRADSPRLPHFADRPAPVPMPFPALAGPSKKASVSMHLLKNITM
jgi:hypothetical protein